MTTETEPAPSTTRTMDQHLPQPPEMPNLGDPKVLAEVSKFVKKLNDTIRDASLESLGPPEVAQRLHALWEETSNLEVVLRRLEFARAQIAKFGASPATSPPPVPGPRLIVPGNIQ